MHSKWFFCRRASTGAATAGTGTQRCHEARQLLGVGRRTLRGAVIGNAVRSTTSMSELSCNCLASCLRLNVFAAFPSKTKVKTPGFALA